MLVLFVAQSSEKEIQRRAVRVNLCHARKMILCDADVRPKKRLLLEKVVIVVVVKDGEDHVPTNLRCM